jgi:tetratricopeptide (TPR) repeat protein
MNTTMSKRAIDAAFCVWFSVAASTAAAQGPPRPPRSGPPPAPPVAPFSLEVPALPAMPPVPPRPAAPGQFRFDFGVDPIPDLSLDLDNILESARQAVELSRAFNALPSSAAQKESSADALYQQARRSIDQGRYERAIEQLERLVNMAGNGRIDAALYWKSYTLAKQGQRAEALTTLADLQKRFADSRWLKDAKALEVEIRQASGQTISPDGQYDEEIKLLALRGLMQSDPDRAVPMIERMLAGNGSVRLQENALFVLSQSRSAKAREIIAGVVRNGNPDLQLRAIRYLGVMGGPENRQTLDEVYRTSTDSGVKRAILRSFMVVGDRAQLQSLAKTEQSADLRAEAIQQLGIMHAGAELSELYQSETSGDLKKRILQALLVSGSADKLIDLARHEKETEVRRAAIRNLGAMGASKTGDALRLMYGSDTGADVRKEIINALFIQQNAAALVALARAEKDTVMKREIVQRLSIMKSKEASEYMLELLK